MDDQLKFVVEAFSVIGGLYAFNRAWFAPRIVRPLRYRYERWTKLFDSMDKISDARLVKLFDSMDKISVALGTNGGSSLADLIRLTSARLTRLMDFIERPIFESDSHGRNVRVNRAFEQMFGYSASEMSGMGWVNVIDPDDRARVEDEWEDAIRGQRAFSTRARFLSKSGVVCYVLMTASPAMDGQYGRVVGWVGAAEIQATSPQPKTPRSR